MQASRVGGVVQRAQRDGAAVRAQQVQHSFVAMHRRQGDMRVALLEEEKGEGGWQGRAGEERGAGVCVHRGEAGPGERV
jgi:hypothetical protein